MNKKVKVASLSIASNTSLIILKVIAGIMSGSVSIISEAIHSMMDLLAAIIAFFSVRVSGNPPDKEHPYGHGKFENISGVTEALLIFAAAVWIIYEAVKKIITRSPIEEVPIGIGVMAISAIVNLIVSRNLYKVAKETDSIALEADALHLKTDVYTSVGVAAGLSVIWIIELFFHKTVTIIDPIVAIFVALLILKESFHLLKSAYKPLIDTALPENEVIRINEIIGECLSEEMSFHRVRTRKSGFIRHVDFHLDLPGNTSLRDAHSLCDTIEEKIKNAYPYIEVEIHTEPIEDQEDKV